LLERNKPIGRDDLHRLASFLWRGSRRSGTVRHWELLVVSQQLIGCEASIVNSDSESFMISNPFLQRMAILAPKKTMLYAFEGRKKSCRIALITTQKIPPYSSDISFVRTLWTRNPLERDFLVTSWESSGPPLLILLTTIGSSMRNKLFN
jgi:hypothetical protein